MRLATPHVLGVLSHPMDLVDIYWNCPRLLTAMKRTILLFEAKVLLRQELSSTRESTLIVELVHANDDRYWRHDKICPAHALRMVSNNLICVMFTARSNKVDSRNSLK